MEIDFGRSSRNGVIDKTDKMSNNKHSLDSKSAVERNTLLTDLFENKYIQNVYNLGVIIFIGVMLNNFTGHLVKNGEINIGQKFMIQCFGKFDIAVKVWVFNFLSSLFCYPAFMLWATIKLKTHPKSQESDMCNKLGIVALVAYLLGVLLYIPFSFAWKYNYSMASSLAALAESVRLTMKCYAFVRSSVPNILNFKPHTEGEMILPKFSQFLYFLFAPTLIYQDEYPKSKSRNWSKIIRCFVEVLLCVIFMSVLMEQHSVGEIRNIGKKKFYLYEIFLHALDQSLLALFGIFIFFYMFFESWMNGWAELLKFADRQFYKDWWLSTSLPRLYNTWNSIVHNFLYVYIYKDFYLIVTKQNVFVSRMAVIVVSAVIHELMLIVSSRVFIPIFFILFLFLTLAFAWIGEIRHWFMNVLFLCAFGFTISLVMTIYTLEHFARANAEPEPDTWHNTLVPKLFRCDCFY